MSVLTIRAHSRFAVCRKALLRTADRVCQSGLLIELSLAGARVSHVNAAAFVTDQLVSLRIDGAEPIEARVRWLRDTTIGLRFVEPLHIAALQELIRICREPIVEDERAYGT